MKGGDTTLPVIPTSLTRLRWRLTAWYVGTFLAVLALLGLGMFVESTRRYDRELDESLGVAAHELASAVSSRDRREGTGTADIGDEVEDLRIPDRSLYLTDTLGTPISREPTDAWVRSVARSAWHGGTTVASHRSANGRTIRARGEAFRLVNGRPLVSVATADEIELEDQYASLIVAFGAAALAALVLVAAGGWLLARQSTAPVEQSIAHMRRFMADAAHELRTPLTVIRSRAEITLQRSREPDDYMSALHGIERESERLGRIVEDLLMLARADAGERPMEHQRVFLDDVTLDAAEAARAIADRKSVRVDVGAFEEAPVRGDPALLRQLVMILLDNAIKFTPAQGRVRVEVRGAAPTPVLIVSDDGIGIPANQLPHIFERFYRGDPSRTRGDVATTGVSDGAGLGLSIAQWIVDQHGATIRIESQPGEGTTIVILFPRAPTAESV